MSPLAAHKNKPRVQKRYTELAIIYIYSNYIIVTSFLCFSVPFFRITVEAK